MQNILPKILEALVTKLTHHFPGPFGVHLLGKASHLFGKALVPFYQWELHVKTLVDALKYGQYQTQTRR